MSNLRVTPSVPEEGVECYWITEDNGAGVADVHGPQSPEREHLANQMATAPELYEALENILGVVYGNGGTKPNAQEVAEKALARARGEQP
ncbi:MAG TPA: hypothetical protein VFM75_02025 [Modicisalibacter sp.]|nr:hypothetical protein [Modicisalibacter sp.]